MRGVIFLIVVLMQMQVQSQTITWDSIRPSTTDAAITTFNARHYYLKSNQDTMQSLVVLIPGTFRYGGEYKFIMEKLALLGYHVVGLSYEYEPTINPLCRPTDDVNCHFNARMETITGIDGHSSVNVTPAESILNRLGKLLLYAANNRPGQGWDQYYVNGQIQWNKIIVVGHSQGGAISGIMGNQYPVKRVIMISIIDYLDSGSIPSWVDNTAGHEKYYALFHPKDELMPFSNVQVGWEKLGMTQHGAMVNIDCNAYPYKNSHILYTNYVPATSLVDKFHNGTCLDSYFDTNTAYKNSLGEAIKYLFRK